MKLSNVPEAYKKLTNRTLETSKLYKKLQKNSSSFISYQEFCLLVAENFTTDGYDIYMADGKIEPTLSLLVFLDYTCYFETSKMTVLKYCACVELFLLN